MENNTSTLLKSRVSGTELSSFYSVVCSRLNLEKPVAKRLLIQLEKEGHIQIEWKHRSGARFYLKSKV